MSSPSPDRIAIVHDWLTGMRGGEKCLEVLCELFPAAPIYTLVAFPEKLSRTILSHEIKTSFLQRFPNIEHRYRHYLPFFPHAIESFRMDEYDLILSSSHAVAKGIKPRSDALHISYVHTPMRYVWEMFNQYFSRERNGTFQFFLIWVVTAYLRRWDVRTAHRVNHYIANSHHIRDRIQRHYNRDSMVIYPPVDTNRFRVSLTDKGYFLVVSALVPYKRIDIAVKGFNAVGLPLRIIGDGPELSSLRSIAGSNIRFDGWLTDVEIETAYAECRALIFPGEEDFGIVPVEAMATGKPVIAFAKGGAKETVRDGETGIHFQEQTVQSFIDAIYSFEHIHFDPHSIRAHATSFDREIYRTTMHTFISEKWDAHYAGAL